MKVERAAVVAEVTGTGQDPGFGWETPAGATAQSMNALLRTQTFVDEVTVAAGLDHLTDSGLLTHDEVRRSVAVYPDGARLVKIVGTNARPDVANSLAEGAIAAYIESVRANEVSDATVAINFLRQKLPQYEDAVTQAEDELATWLADHPDPPGDAERPVDQQVSLQRLQDTIKRQEDQLTAVRASIEQQELAVEQKEAEVRQRLEVIDPPQEPFAPQPTTKKTVITVAMALVVGSLLSLVAVVVGTILDRTIRFPGDVKDRLDTRVLAVVPKARLTGAMRKKLEVVEEEPVPVALSTAEQVEPEPEPEPEPVNAGAVEGDVATTDADRSGRTGERGTRPLAGTWLKRVN